VKLCKKLLARATKKLDQTKIHNERWRKQQNNSCAKLKREAQDRLESEKIARKNEL